ncbi:MAG: ABC transporter ATP-binding protein [Caulobacteraceae bacterium]|nr:ABC transporter ATP-binding protein [Caulobacteraceae bacterium]
MSTIEDDDEDEVRQRTLSNAQVLRFVAGFWMRRRLMFFPAVGLMLAAVGFDLTMPWAARGLVDGVAAPAAGAVRHAPWGAWAAFVGVNIGFALTRNASLRFWNPLAARNMEEMTNEAFQRVQSFSSDWHANNFAGATVRKVSRAMWGYDLASDSVVLSIGPAVLVLVGLSLSMLLRWPLVGLFSLTVVLVYIAANVALVQFYVRPANLRSIAYDSRIGGALADAISANPTVKAFGAEAREDQRLAGVTRAWSRAAQRTWGRFMDVWAIQNVILIVLVAGLSGLLVWLWSIGQASAGDVAFAITSFLLMSGYLRNVGENVRMIQRGLDDAEDVAAFMRQAPQVADAEGAADFAPGLGEIAFDHVTFRYKSQAAPLYERFSLVIAPGERAALVGSTGSGKSTFVKLVQRLYDIEAGRILIDGQDIAAVSQGSLRRAIAVVPQDPALFHRTVAENIGYARPGATLDEIVLAARRARAHEFILRLPKGYDTLVGERGVKLSGGERQRVAIARAFLADAPVLVLDEATSSLDVETEREVQAATEALMQGRTTIVIAHRLSTIRHADRILVFQGGRVIEEGRHGDLVAQGGAYARLNAVAEGAA